MIVIIDESKLVTNIATQNCCRNPTLRIFFYPQKMEQLGYLGKWRCGTSMDLNQELYVTDNGNFCLTSTSKLPSKPEKYMKTWSVSPALWIPDFSSTWSVG